MWPSGQSRRCPTPASRGIVLLAALLLLGSATCRGAEEEEEAASGSPFVLHSAEPQPSIWERASHQEAWTPGAESPEDGLYPKVEEWKRNMEALLPDVLEQIEAAQAAEARAGPPSEPAVFEEPARRRMQQVPGQIQRLGLTTPGFDAPISPAAVYAALYRHDSVVIPPSVNWSTTAAMTPVPRQLECESCWAMAVADSISIMWALSEGLGFVPCLPPGVLGQLVASWWPQATQMSVQQILDCTSGNTGCQGGWPEWAYSYVSDVGGLVPATQYGYLARSQACPNTFLNLTAQITTWERTPMMDITSIKKAVANQPVLTFISAVSSDFQHYKGGIYGANGTANCTSDLDHVVLITGYGTDPVWGPYWIIKNTWGSDWGENGFMRIAMQDGAGVCGITSSPGLYPVFLPNANARNLCYVSFPPPCGSGWCYTTTANTVQRCWCPVGYTEFAVNGNSKCVASNPCSRNPNPCGPGTCRSNQDGTYSCSCFQGSLIGAKADGSQTCISMGSGVGTYTVMASDTCQSIIAAFNLTPDVFMLYNGALDCYNLLPGTVVAVGIAPTSPNCTATYVVETADTLVTIAANLSTTVERLLQLNPTLSSALHGLDAGLTICVDAAQLAAVSKAPPLCGLTYNVIAGGGRDQCAWILSTFALTLAEFLSINPGLRCPGPSDPPLSPSVVVCVAPQSISTLPVVNCTSYYTVQHGDNCPVIWNNANLTASQFYLLNPGIQCDPHYLKIGQPLCVQGPQTNNFTTTIPYQVQAGDTLAMVAGQFRARCGIYASAAGICAANRLDSCSAAPAAGQTLLVPCQWPVGRSCGCPSAGTAVCGADGNWYPNYCSAVCNYATPANSYTNGGCSDTQLACQGHSCFGAPDWVENYFPASCPYPTWWPIDYSWWGTDVCSFYRGACWNCCTGSLTNGYYQGYPMSSWYACYNTCKGHVNYGC